ncbi:MAG: S-layer family protein, partial [Desulfobacterales bacterium]|nr:S-layer family protein [Desulfobacterales bacterium]
TTFQNTALVDGAAGAVSITAAEKVTVDGAIAGDTVSIESTTADLDVNNTINSDVGGVTLIAGTNIVTEADDTITAEDVAALTADGNITLADEVTADVISITGLGSVKVEELDSAGTITVSAGTTFQNTALVDGAAGAVSITAAEKVTADGAIAGGTINIESTTADLDINNSVTAGSSLNAAGTFNTDLILTAVNAGTNGNNISLTILDDDGSGNDVSVTVNGDDITVTIDSDQGHDTTDIANAIKDHADAAVLVEAVGGVEAGATEGPVQLIGGTASGSLVLKAGTDIVTDNGDTIFSGKSVTITADGDVTLGDTVTADAGVLSIVADADNDAVDFGDVTAAADLSGDSVLIRGYNVTVDNVTADAGDINILAEQAIDADNTAHNALLNASQNIVMNAGSSVIVDDLSTAVGDILINAGTTFVKADDTDIIARNDLMIEANTSINPGTGGNLKATDGILTLISGGTVTTTGVTVSAGGGMALSSDTDLTVGATTSDGKINAVAGETLTVTGDISGASVNFEAGEDMVVEGSVDSDSDGDPATSGAISLIAADGITIDDNDNTTADVDASGVLTIIADANNDGTGDLSVGETILDESALLTGAVVGISGEKIRLDAVTSTADDITITAADTFQNDSELTSVADVVVISGSSMNIAGGIDAFANVSIAAGGTIQTTGAVEGENISLESTGGNLDIDQTVTASSSAVGTFNSELFLAADSAGAAGDAITLEILDVGGTATPTVGVVGNAITVTIDTANAAHTNAAIADAINTDIGAGGAAELVDATGSASAAAAHAATALIGGGVSGSMTFAASGTFNNAETLTAVDDIAIQSGSTMTLVNDVTAGGGVTLEAGSYLDGSGITVTATDLEASAGGANAGVAIDLDTLVSNLWASTSAAGDITIDNDSGLTVVDVMSHDGTVDISSVGKMTVQKVVSGDAGGTGTDDVLLDTTSGGDIDAGFIQSANDVTLNAAGKITDGAGDVVGNVLTIDAATGVELTTEVASITSAGAKTVSGTGTIAITEKDGVELTRLISDDGAITVTAGGTVTATTVVAGGDQADDDLSIITSAGNINIGTVTADGNDVTLRAEAGALVDATSNVDGAIITLVAGGDGLFSNDIGDAVNAINVDGTTRIDANAAENNGSIWLDNTAGDFMAGRIDAGTGDITIISQQGFTDANANGVLNLVGGIVDVTLNLDGGGPYAFEADTAMDSITIADASAVDIEEADAITITSIGAAGQVDLTANGIITLTDSAITASGQTVNVEGSGIFADNANAIVEITAATLNLTATNGGIGVGEIGVANPLTFNATTIVNADSSAAGGNMALTSTDAFKLGVLDAGSGDVTLVSGGDITDESDADENIIGNNVDISLSAASGSIGMVLKAGADAAIETDINTLTVNSLNVDNGLAIVETDGIDLIDITIASGTMVTDAAGQLRALTVSTGGNAISLEASLGDVVVDSVDAGAATVDITAGGAISELADGDAAADITGTILTLISGAGIGAGNAIETDAGTIGFTAENTVEIYETNGTLSVSGVTTGSANTNNGSIIIATDSTDAGATLTVSGALTANGGGAISLTAGNATADVVINGGAVSSTSGDISIVAGQNITQTGAGDTISTLGDVSLTAGAGNITYNQADGSVSGDDLNLSAVNGTIDVDTSVSTITAQASGLVTIDEVNAVELVNVYSIGAGAITVDAGGKLMATSVVNDSGAVMLRTDNGIVADSTADIVAGTVTANSPVTINADGAILDGAGEVTADTFNLDAKTGIGTAASAVTLVGDGVTTIEANTAAGNIYLDNAPTGAVSLGANGITTGSAGTVSYVQSGQTLTVDNAISSVGGLILLDNVGDIDITAGITSNDGAVNIDSGGTINLGAAISSGAGDVSIDAAGLTTVSAAGSITATNGDVSFGKSLAGAVALAGSPVTTAGGGILFNNAVTLGSDVTLSTGGGAVGGDITFVSTVTGAPSLTLEAGAGNVSLKGLVSVNGGFDSSGADFLYAGASLNTVGSDIVINHTGDVSLSAALSSTGGAINIDAGTLLVNAPIQSGGGDIDLDGTVSITIAGAGDINAGVGQVDIGEFSGGPIATSANVTTAGGNITFHNATTLGDSVTLDTGTAVVGNVTFAGTLDATAANGQGLTVEAGTGAVNFAGAVGGGSPLEQVKVENAGSVTSASTIDTNVFTISNGGAVNLGGTVTSPGGFTSHGISFVYGGTNITTTGSNAITIEHSGAITLNAALNAVSGKISVNSTASNLDLRSAINSTDGEVLLTANGDVTLTGSITTGNATNSAVSVTSGGSIHGDTDSAMDISAVSGTLTMNAGGTIGSPNPLELNVKSLRAHGGGIIKLAATGSISLEDVDSAGGDISITAQDDIVIGDVNAGTQKLSLITGGEIYGGTFHGGEVYLEANYVGYTGATTADVPGSSLTGKALGVSPDGSSLRLYKGARLTSAPAAGAFDATAADGGVYYVGLETYTAQAVLQALANLQDDLLPSIGSEAQADLEFLLRELLKEDAFREPPLGIFIEFGDEEIIEE